jgi:hypothetical protein
VYIETAQLSHTSQTNPNPTAPKKIIIRIITAEKLEFLNKIISLPLAWRISHTSYHEFLTVCVPSMLPLNKGLIEWDFRYFETRMAEQQLLKIKSISPTQQQQNHHLVQHQKIVVAPSQWDQKS